MNLIPGTTEWGYDTQLVRSWLPGQLSIYENRNNSFDKTDIKVAIEQLEEACPHCDYISLAIAWFGSSSDMSQCQIAPKVTYTQKSEVPTGWSVGGLGRGSVGQVKRNNGRPIFGGSPSDQSIINLVSHLKARGFKIMLHPIIVLDRKHSTGSAYIKARDDLSKNDLTLASNAFFGSGDKDDFSINQSSQTVRWTGNANEWSFRRFIYHYAHLCALMGGVDAFLLSSGLEGITKSSSGGGFHPCVDEMVDIASEVKKILPQSKISYGANQSEYNGYPHGRNYYFHLDDFWASPNVDFVGVQYFMPLSDWRDNLPNRDGALTDEIYDIRYLIGNIHGGEEYEWYYASQAGRRAQDRVKLSTSPRAWVWRGKDISGWWRNAHYNRVNGESDQQPTAWQAGSKPIWFTAAGCPAIDKGSNQPRNFPIISSNSSLILKPYFSNGERDDYIQNRYIEALTRAFDKDDVHHLDDFNIEMNGHHMIDPQHIFFWGWDARPYPWFPDKSDRWADTVNWERGHWLNGRTSYARLPDLVEHILSDYGITKFNVSKLRSSLKGMRIDRVMTARDALIPLSQFFFFDIIDRGDEIYCLHRDGAITRHIQAQDCVADESGEGYQLTHKQDKELPSAVKLSFIDETNYYHQAIAEAKRQNQKGHYIAQAKMPIVADPQQALAAALTWLYESWMARDHASLRLPPQFLDLEIGDVIAFICAHKQEHILRITEIIDEDIRLVSAVGVLPSIYHGHHNSTNLAVLLDSPAQSEAQARAPARSQASAQAQDPAQSEAQAHDDDSSRRVPLRAMPRAKMIEPQAHPQSYAVILDLPSWDGKMTTSPIWQYAYALIERVFIFIAHPIANMIGLYMRVLPRHRSPLWAWWKLPQAKRIPPIGIDRGCFGCACFMAV